MDHHRERALAQAHALGADELYFQPVMKRARQLGVRSALGQLIVWDTIVQHGEGDPNEDPDGLPAIANEVVTEYGTVAGNEAAWLADFLRVRRGHLLNPAERVDPRRVA